MRDEAISGAGCRVRDPASPLVEAHVTRACEGLGRFADETGVELEQEFGGRMPCDRAPGEAAVQ